MNDELTFYKGHSVVPSVHGHAIYLICLCNNNIAEPM